MKSSAPKIAPIKPYTPPPKTTTDQLAPEINDKDEKPRKKKTNRFRIDLGVSENGTGLNLPN